MSLAPDDVVEYRSNDELQRGIVHEALQDVVIVERGDDVEYLEPEAVEGVVTGLRERLWRAIM